MKGWSSLARQPVNPVTPTNPAIPTSKSNRTSGSASDTFAAFQKAAKEKEARYTDKNLKVFWGVNELERGFRRNFHSSFSPISSPCVAIINIYLTLSIKSYCKNTTKPTTAFSFHGPKHLMRGYFSSQGAFYLKKVLKNI